VIARLNFKLAIRAQQNSWKAVEEKEICRFRWNAGANLALKKIQNSLNTFPLARSNSSLVHGFGLEEPDFLLGFLVRLFFCPNSAFLKPAVVFSTNGAAISVKLTPIGINAFTAAIRASLLEPFATKNQRLWFCSHA
jgi:hypothetical protein